ncbi:MAG TPA: glycosyltransferase family 2 protein [Acidimicrobiia bacterium]|nr:glycosyltransferase family 2 protein [Acidimicrobiia bacterium]
MTEEDQAHLQAVAAELGLAAEAGEQHPAFEGDFRPLVSVVVPVHNDDRFVAAALESVKRQSYDHWECVVVDDASTDSSWNLVKSSVADDERFRVLRSETNLGPGGARNLALTEASGEYLVFLDGDDLLLRLSLEDRVNALAGSISDPFVVGSFCGVRLSHEDTALDELADHYRSTQPAFMDFVVAGGEAPFPMTAPLVMTERVRSIGGLDASMVSGGVDWDLWYRILRNGHVFVSSPFQSVVYRQRAGGITRGNPASHTAAAARLIRAAHQTADPSILVDPSPFPLPEPLGHYQAIISVAERATRFATMALVDGDRAGMEETFGVLDPGSWPLLERHLDIPSLVTRGAARALGRKPVDLEGAGELLAPFVGEVTKALKRATQ